MDSKRKARYYLKLLCQELGVPDIINVDGSKDQVCRVTKFMNEIHRQVNNYNISDTELNNKNSVEGFIREARHKWYRTVVKKILPIQLWYYGVSWVSEVMSINHSSENIVNWGIPLKNVT